MLGTRIVRSVSEAKSVNTSTTTSRRGLGRRLSRIIFRLLLLLLIVSTAALILYVNRVHLINQTLAYLIAPFRVQVGEIDFFPFGQVRISDLTLTPKDAPDGSPLARISEARITYRLSELRATNRFDDLSLFGAHVRLDQKNLDTLLSPRASESGESHPENLSSDLKEAEPFLLSRLAVFTGSLSAENGRIQVDLDAFPPLETEWDFHCERFDLEGIRPTTLSCTLRNLQVGKDASGGQIALLSGKASLAPDLSQVEIESLLIRSPDLRITPELFPRSASSESQAQKTQQGQLTHSTLSDHPGKSPTFLLRGLQIEDARLALTGFDGKGSLPSLPDLSFAVSATFPEIRFQNGLISNDQPLSLDFTSVHAGSESHEFFSSDRVHLRLHSLSDLIHRQQIAEVRIANPTLLASDESLARLLSSTKNEKNHESVTSPPWVIQSFVLDSGSLKVEKLTLPESVSLPDLSATLSAELKDLRFGGADGFYSDGRQSLSIRQLRINAPGATEAKTPLLNLSQVDATVDWKSMKSEHRIEKIALREPLITLTDETLGSWADVLTALATTSTTPRETRLDQPTTPVPVSSTPAQTPVYAVTDLSLTSGKLLIDTSAAHDTIPKVQADLLIETRTDSQTPPDSYRLTLSDVAIQSRVLDHDHLSHIASPEDGILSVKKLHADFNARELQQDKRIGVVRLDGALLTVGDGLKSTFGQQLDSEKLAQPDAAKPAPKASASSPSPSAEPASVKEESAPAAELEKPSASVPSTSAPDASLFPTDSTKTPASAAPQPPTTSLPGGWSIGEIEISRSEVHFKSLIPQVQGLQFAIETKLRDIPLTLQGLLSQSTPQKIELTGIEIKDPYDSFITVAELPTIFVEFSLAGLGRQEIERIQLISPSLWVGQGLFWWIDYQRNFREQNEGARVRFEDGPEKKTDWSIKTIEASSGKIVIAPAGVPIGAVPFPFNATTSMSGGEIELKLNIPDEDHIYRFPDYKVEVQGLVGDVQFNVPVKTEDNNLVQTFSLRRARWKEYEAKDLYLSVTFDEGGVYGHFGGAAYKGYVDGQFNFYLDGQGKWDAWIAGTDLDTGPVTSILVPDSFLMDGRVSLKLVSEGSGTTLGKTTGDFHTTTSGWFDITKIDPILQELPPEWTMLQRGLTELGLNAIKRFDYDQGTGKVDFHNREGTLTLGFTGPYGKRQLNIAVHDDAAQPHSHAEKVAATPAPMISTTSPEKAHPSESAESTSLTKKRAPKKRDRFDLFRRKARP